MLCKINMQVVCLIIVLITATSVFGQSTLESIPNQKLINGSYVSNPDNILDGATTLQIDTLLKSIEEKTSCQIAVVVVESIGDEDIFDFAQKLFNSWGIGKDGKDNGLLVMLVKDKHTVRFHTGYGLEGVLPDIVCKRIQREYMVPDFKNGNYNAGMLGGLSQVEKVLTDQDYAEELKTPEANEATGMTALIIFLSILVAPVLLVVYIIKAINKRFADSKAPEDSPYPEMRLKRGVWLLEFVALPILIITLFAIRSADDSAPLCILTLYLYFLGTCIHRLWRMQKVINRFLAVQDYYEIVEFLRKGQWYWFFMGLLFPVPLLIYFFYHLIRKRRYRNHPRKCKQCESALIKLNEKTEDAYLSAGQQLEEKLRSVDYDVWKCKSCEAIAVWFYLNQHSKYQPCPKCKTIAYHSISKHTIVSATYSSSGTGEEVHGCSFCQYQKKSTYHIPQLVHSTDTSSSGSSSSSSSGGGSWGGGSSGGGGASSSW